MNTGSISHKEHTIKILAIITFITVYFVCTYAAAPFVEPSIRYEAEDALVDENSVEKIEYADASGGFYINMKEGDLSFTVNADTAGFYTLWAFYSQPNDSNEKIQNLSVNGVATGQISFPKIDSFVMVKASLKIRLSAGSNTIGITHSWGWVNIDYVAITGYIESPFAISPQLVTPNASENARKMFGFIRQNFQKKVISGVMTNRVMQNDGKYTPFTVETQEEVAWIKEASGKVPALLGLDFMHSAGPEAEDEWFAGYTNGTIALAEDVFTKGGIPVYCWHWKDPSHTTDAFYSPSASGQTPAEFDLTKAFTDPGTCKEFDTESSEYRGIIRDIDIISGHLKQLADKNVPVLWRPLHEASGGWFWWGYKGAAPCKELYLLMFDRMVHHHGLNNLIWVWTTDEAADAIDWYPGDDYVDIIGRDFYYYPREANHGSLVASFEKVKEMYDGRKIIALTENGSVPFAEEMEEDGAGWSFFMPWYGDYTMDGWAHDNTAADWKKIMNHDFVLTLDEMPGWEQYIVPVTNTRAGKQSVAPCLQNLRGMLECIVDGKNKTTSIKLYRLNGCCAGTFSPDAHTEGVYRFSTAHLARGMYIVRTAGSFGIQHSLPVMVK